MKNIALLLTAIFFLQSCNRGVQPPTGYGLKYLFAVPNGCLLLDTSLNGMQAFLQVVNLHNQLTDTLTLNYPEITTVKASPYFRYTVNRSAGMGSYNGYETEFFSVENGKIIWLTAQDSSGKSSKIHLLSSLKSWWKFLPTTPPRILAVDCRPDLNAAARDSVTFHTTYTRYKQTGEHWTKTQRVERGFIEFESNNDSIPDARFPD